MTETEKPETEELPANQAKAETSETDSSIEAAKSAPGKTKSTPWAMIAVAVLAIAGLAGGAATWEKWKDIVLPDQGGRQSAASTNAPPFRPAADVDVLRSETAALKDRLAQLEKRPSMVAAPGGAVMPAFDAAPLEARLGKAESAVQALQAAPQLPADLIGKVDGNAAQLADLKKTSADAAAVLRLADRLDKLEAEMRDIQAKRSSAVAVLLAAGQVREALARSMPYDSELRALTALAGNDPEIERIAQVLKMRSATGLPSFTVLAARFGRMAPDLVRAQVLPDEQTWWRQTLNRLASLVTIRREDGEAAGDDAAAITARIDARLAEGDMIAAAEEAGRFSGGAAERAAPWLADLNDRLAADKAASELTAHVVAQVGGKQ